MLSHSWQPMRVLTAAVLAFTVPQVVIGQTSQHVVSPLELQQATQDATHLREQNIGALQRFLGSADAQKAMEKAHMDPQRVQNAIAGLSDHELAQLAARATKAQNDFAAGNLSNNDLLILLLVIAALILIIVAVK